MIRVFLVGVFSLFLTSAMFVLACVGVGIRRTQQAAAADLPARRALFLGLWGFYGMAWAWTLGGGAVMVWCLGQLLEATP